MIEGKRMSIYLREEQLQWLDAQSKAEGVSRSRYIERKVFPQGLWIIKERRGRPRKGEEKGNKGTMMNNEMLKDIKIRNAYRRLASDVIVQAMKDKEKYEKFLATGKRAENKGLYVSEHDFYTAKRFLKSDWCEMLKSLAFGDV